MGKIVLVFLMILALSAIIVYGQGQTPDELGVKQIAVAPLPDGRLQLWAIDTNGQLWSCWKQTTEIGALWTEWSRFKMPPVSGIQQISVAPSANPLQLWAVDETNQLWSCWRQTTKSDYPWTEWSRFTKGPINGLGYSAS